MPTLPFPRRERPGEAKGKARRYVSVLHLNCVFARKVFMRSPKAFSIIILNLVSIIQLIEISSEETVN
jgi:hypothetical protein